MYNPRISVGEEMKKPTMTWDPEAKAIYIRVRKAKVFRTVTLAGIHTDINADVDKKDKLIGVEILL